MIAATVVQASFVGDWPIKDESHPVAFLSDPVQASPLLGAARWIEASLLGTIATLVAIICVASIGWLLLSGRLDARRGLVVVLGCFVLFGSATIAQGLLGLVDPQPTVASQQVIIADDPPVQPPVPPPAPSAQYDPYAGASVIR